MESIEISDRDGDALTITTGADGVWISCTQGSHEVTVGPLLADDLHIALAQISVASPAARSSQTCVG
ncbi:hypothetical protein [Brachybacterium tyrofermentans]|uniref:hypothetical protein n=1 Tax=Brachybacterium TaxID=43668 RepID=UPI003D1FC428